MLWFRSGEFYLRDSSNGLAPLSTRVTLWSNLKAPKLNSFQMKLNLETSIKTLNAHKLSFQGSEPLLKLKETPEMRKKWVSGPKHRFFCPPDLLLQGLSYYGRHSLSLFCNSSSSLQFLSSLWCFTQQRFSPGVALTSWVSRFTHEGHIHPTARDELGKNYYLHYLLSFA